MPNSRRERKRHGLNENGITLIEALVSAVILGIGLYLAVQGYSVNVGNLATARHLSSLQQVDSFLSNAIATQMNALMRRAASNNVCNTTATLSAIPAPSNLPATTVIQYFNTLLQSAVSSNTLLVQQLVLNAQGTGQVSPLGALLGDSYFQTGAGVQGTGGATNNASFPDVDPEADRRLRALARCYSEQWMLGAAFDYSAKSQIYFCAYLSPEAGTTTAVAAPNAMEMMHAFGEFVYVVRNLSDSTTTLTCSAYNTLFNSNVANLLTPSPIPFAVNGELYYTLYWASDPPIAGHFHHYTGNAAVADSSQQP